MLPSPFTRVLSPTSNFQPTNHPSASHAYIVGSSSSYTHTSLIVQLAEYALKASISSQVCPHL